MEEVKGQGIPEIKLSFQKTNNYGKITTSGEAAKLIRNLFDEGSIELQEHAIILYMNRVNDVIGFYRHTVGGIAGTIIETRLILSAGIKSLSSSIIIAHNHPSGKLEPSPEDIKMTDRLKAAAKLVDIGLLDSLIITKDGHYSFSDNGMMGLGDYREANPDLQIIEEKKGSSIQKTVKVQEIERLEDELRFIKRYASLHGKVKTDSQILSFLNAVQKAILEKRIRKTSPYANEINYIQNSLIRLHNVMGNKVEIKINKEVLKRFLSIAGSKKIRLSVNYLKRYIGIQGKKLTKEKAARLIELMRDAVKKGKLTNDDPYVNRLDEAFSSLELFVKNAKKGDTLEVHPAILNGINKTLNGCGCEKKHRGLNGIGESKLKGEDELPTKPSIMNSMDFAKLKFETLGFTGKWKDLIGDPSKGFTAMVFGKPKMGKSYLCIDFAGYLAREHGNTLYVAKEESLDKTLQDKLNDKNVKHPRLFVSDHIPNDLTFYQFIFLDSVNKLGLEPDDLEKLKANNPSKSFIYIFQTTKMGNFRGGNQFQHDVDAVIEVPEKGKAIQFGRFNQGAEMNIF